MKWTSRDACSRVMRAQSSALDPRYVSIEYLTRLLSELHEWEGEILAELAHRALNKEHTHETALVR